MKKIELLFVATLFMFIAASCSDDDDPVGPTDEPITFTKGGGFYYGPLEENHTAANLELWLGTTSINQNNFNISGNGTALLLQMFVTDNEAGTLPTGTYKAAAATSSPAVNTFATGSSDDEDISYIYIKEDDSAANLLRLTDGTISIAQEGNTYTVTGTVKASDGKDYEFKYSGALNINDEREEPDFIFENAEGLYFGELFHAGFDNYYLSFATEGVTGTGTELVLDLYGTATGNTDLPEGQYNAYVNGDGNLEYTFITGGASYLNTLNNGSKSVENISNGSLTVSNNGNTYTITGTLFTEEGEEYLVNYTGTISFEDKTTVSGVTVNLGFTEAFGTFFGDFFVDGFDNWSLFLMTEGLFHDGTTYVGEGTVLTLDLFGPLAGDPDIPAATYIPYDSSNPSSHTFVPWKLGEYGEEGSIVLYYVNGTAVDEYRLAEGDITIVKNGNNNLLTANFTSDDQTEIYCVFKGDFDIFDLTSILGAPPVTQAKAITK